MLIKTPFCNVADIGSVRQLRFPKGFVLFHEGTDFNSRAYLIDSGEVHVFTESLEGVPCLLFRLGPGELVGELGFFGHRQRTATVSAATPVLLSEINRQTWQQIIASENFDRRMASHFYHRYIETHNVIKRLGQPRVEHRLVIYLLGLREWRESRCGEMEIRLPTHRELAQLMCCTRERISVLILKWAEKGLIRRAGKQRYYLDRRKLLEYIESI